MNHMRFIKLALAAAAILGMLIFVSALHADPPTGGLQPQYGSALYTGTVAALSGSTAFTIQPSGTVIGPGSAWYIQPNGTMNLNGSLTSFANTEDDGVGGNTATVGNMFLSSTAGLFNGVEITHSGTTATLNGNLNVSGTGNMPGVTAGAASSGTANAVALPTKTLIYCESSSIMYGPVLGTSGTAAWSSGGATLSIPYDLSSSPYFSNCTFWNDGVPSSTSAQAIARYSGTGNPYNGTVTVPSAHSLATSGSYGQKYAIIETGAWTVNDGNTSVPISTSEANFVALTGSFAADGFKVIVVLSNYYNSPFGNTFNQAILSGTGSANLWIPPLDMRQLMPDPFDTNFYSTVTAPLLCHLTPYGCAFVASAVQAAMRSQGTTAAAYPGTFIGGVSIYNQLGVSTPIYFGLQGGAYYAGGALMMSFIGPTANNYFGEGFLAEAGGVGDLLVTAPSGDQIDFVPGGLNAPPWPFITSTGGTYTTGTAGVSGNVTIGGTATAASVAATTGSFGTYLNLPSTTGTALAAPSGSGTSTVTTSGSGNVNIAQSAQTVSLQLTGTNGNKFNFLSTTGTGVDNGITTLSGSQVQIGSGVNQFTVTANGGQASFSGQISSGGNIYVNGILYSDNFGALSGNSIDFGGSTTLTSIPGSITLSGTATLSGTLVLSGTVAAPSNTVTPVAWGAVTESGSNYKIPLYQ